MAKNITKLKHRFPLKQIRKMPKFLAINWPIFALIIFSIILCFLNFSPGTFLSGWDNLHPEFAPEVNLKRALFSVWQEYQSFGLLGGMAHAADLPKNFLFWLISFSNFPLNYYRYGWTFLMLIIGPLGVYFFLDNYLLKNKFSSLTTKLAGFLGGLFYLLNLSTLQSFFTPFDTFTAFYGFFPWILFIILHHLAKPSIKNTFALLAISLIATPSFYTETMFVVLGFCLVPFFIEEIFSHKRIIPEIISSLKTFLVLLVPNLFWLLPVIFFVITNGSVGEAAKINTIATQETYARNLQFGNLNDLALLKGFWFNYLDSTGNGNYDYLLRVWRNHLQTISVSIIGYILFAVVVVGIYYALKKKLVYFKSILSVLFICFFFLMGGGLLINQKIPLIGELFRSPFTKFSIPLSFAYACFFSVGSIFLLDLFTFLHNRFTYIITFFSIAFSLIIFMSPAFSGQFISPTMRVKIPDEYFQLFDYFKAQPPATRIANFPQLNFWGWYYYDWGYRGSGFLWYGIKQPIIDRTFDVWDRSGEKYYEEISAAIYSNDYQSFDNLINKYSIDYLLIDNHVVSPDNRADTRNKEIKEHLDISDKYIQVKNFNDKIFVYKNNHNLSSKTNYLSITSQSSTTNPFSALSLRPNQDIKVETDKIIFPAISLSNTSETNTENTLSIPSLTDTESLIPISVSYQKTPGTITLRLTPEVPSLQLNGSEIMPKANPTFIDIPVSSSNQDLVLQIDSQYYELQLPAEIESFSYFPLVSLYVPSQKPFVVKIYDGSFNNEMDVTNSLKAAIPYQCFTDKPNRKIEKIVTQAGISLLGTDVVGCLSSSLPPLSTEGVISYSFTYYSNTNTSANVNITNLNLGSLDISQPLNPQKYPKRVRLFSAVSEEPQKINLILEANQAKSIQEINYEDVRLYFHPIIFSTQTSLQKIPSTTISLENKTNTLEAFAPVINSQLDIVQNGTSNQLSPEARNCDQFNNGLFKKTISENGITYESKNAISCDYLDLRQQPHSLNYLLTFNYRYSTGLPMVVCMENQSTNRCDVYERLTKSSGSQSIINPIRNSEEFPGYGINLLNVSIGSQISKGTIESFTIHPIPLKFLKSITLSSQESSNQNSAITNFQSTHPAEFLYTMQTNYPEDTKLNLFQTKSPYWIALRVPSNQLNGDLLSYLWKLPFLNLTEPKLAPATNDTNWYNSWILPKGENTLFIFYYPQYLQFLGLIILVLTTIALLLWQLTQTKIFHLPKKYKHQKKSASES